MTEYRQERRQRIAEGKEQPTSHGITGYVQGCRCEECKRANTERFQRWVEAGDNKGQRADQAWAWRALIQQGEAEPTSHGITGYSQGCRCDTCRAAKRDANAEYRQRNGG